MKIYTKKSSSEKKQALMIAYKFTVDELSSALSFSLYQLNVLAVLLVPRAIASGTRRRKHQRCASINRTSIIMIIIPL